MNLGLLYEYGVAVGAAGAAISLTTAAARNLYQRWEYRQQPIPAADDNQPGHDADLLWECRRIGSEPLADPDASRRLLNDIHNQPREEKP